MRAYPRALNRVIIFAVALVLLAAGVSLIAAAALPLAAKQWEATGSAIEQWWTSTSRQSVVLGQDFSWMSILLVALGIIATILLLGIVFNQGGGRAHNLRDPYADERGQTRLTTGFLSDLVSQQVAQNRWIHSVSASSYLIRKQPVIALDFITFKGASPDEVARDAHELVSDLDQILGKQHPVYVHIKTNWQSNVSTRKRVK
ncbi:MAG: hypothetical protein Q4D87_07240 [Actinomycetaceae bacterium]|nr:hypothetical protein [Actinomycetaceae bacterium]